jgi:hypothetical protein
MINNHKFGESICSLGLELQDMTPCIVITFLESECPTASGNSALGFSSSLITSSQCGRGSRVGRDGRHRWYRLQLDLGFAIDTFS